MSKYSFMQTPEQRQRADYYKKQRKVKSGNIPLLTDPMVEVQPIETQSELTQEMALNDAVFEYATPNMPSASDVMASFDRGTAGMWAEVGADVTGNIMSITGDMYKHNARKKKDKQKRMLEGFRNIELQKIQEKIQQEMATAAQARANGEAVAPIDINARIKELKQQATFEAGKKLFTIENGSEELNEAIEAALLERKMEPGTFDSLPMQDRMDILETAFIHEDNFLYNLFGDGTNIRKENLWSDLQASANSVDYGKQSENLKEFRHQIVQSGLQAKGLNDQDSTDSGYEFVLGGEIPLDFEYINDPKNNLFPGDPESYETEDGRKLFVSTRDEEGKITGIQWNGQATDLLADERYNDKIGLILARQLKQSNPSAYSLHFPKQLTDALRDFTTNPDFGIEENPSLSVAIPYLAMKNMDTVEDLLLKDKGDGGLGIDVANRPKLLTTLLVYQSEQAGTRNLTQALNTTESIFNADNFNSGYRSVTGVDADTGMMSDKGNQSLKSALSAMDEINGTKYADMYEEYNDTVAFDLADNPSMAILVTTLSNIDRSALPQLEKDELRRSIIQNSYITPMLSVVGEEGEQAITGFLMHNPMEYSLNKIAGGDSQKRIELELSAPHDMKDPDLAAALDVVLNNLSLDADDFDNRDEWRSAVLDRLEINRVAEMAARKTATSDYRISPRQFNETILFMTPSVQERLLNLKAGSVSNTQTIIDNYEKIIRLSPEVTYKPGTNRAIEQRNEGSYTQSPFGYNVDRITLTQEGKLQKIFDVGSLSFPSRGSSGIVFPSVYAQNYDEGNQKVKRVDHNSLATRIQREPQAVGLGQAAIDYLSGTRDSDTPAAGLEPPDETPTEIQARIEAERQQLTGYWKRWHNMSFMDIVDDVAQDFFFQTVMASDEAIEKLPGLFKEAGEELSKLPGELKEALIEEGTKLPGKLQEAGKELLGLPGDVVDAVGGELNKRGITSYFTNMFANFMKADDEEKMNIAIRLSEDIPEFAEAMDEATASIPVTDEEVQQLDNAPLPETQGKNKTETTKRQQKIKKELDFYLDRKIERSGLTPKIKNEVRGLIDSREEMIELIELTKRNSRANNLGNLEDRVVESVEKAVDTIPESVDRVLDIPNQVNQKIIRPTFLGIYQTLIDLYVRSRN